MALKTYNPKDVVITVATIPIQGFTDGDFITVEYTDDAFTKEKGADGEITRNYNPATDGTFTITLKGSSSSNDYLSGLHIADRASLGGIFPIFVKDTNGTSLAGASEAWIRKQSNFTRGTTVGDTEWVIDCAEMVLFTAGQN